MARDPRRQAPRPGFVLDVDRSTPPIMFHHGEGFRLEKLPADRSRVIYPAEPLPGIADPDGAVELERSVHRLGTAGPGGLGKGRERVGARGGLGDVAAGLVPPGDRDVAVLAPVPEHEAGLGDEALEVIACRH